MTNNEVYFEEKNSQWKGSRVSYSQLHRWLRQNLGTLSKCEECGTTEAKRFEWANVTGKYVRTGINWRENWKRLCSPCHRKRDTHLLPKGEQHCRAKLTEEDVIKICSLYVYRKYGAYKLSKEFGVSSCVIKRVVNGLSWKHVNRPSGARKMKLEIWIILLLLIAVTGNMGCESSAFTQTQKQTAALEKFARSQVRSEVIQNEYLKVQTAALERIANGIEAQLKECE